MGCVQMPLHEVELKSDLVCGVVKLGVRKQLTVAGVDFILGNDLDLEMTIKPLRL